MALTARMQAELRATLDDHIQALKTAGERFDQGRLIEAHVLAIHIRALVHEGPKSPALIDELGLQDQLTWVDTGGVPNPKTASSASCLTLMKVRTGMRPGGEYVPKLGLYPPAPIRTRGGEHINRGSRIPFHEWWTNPVIKDADGLEYSRKLLVLALGGGDDDPEADVARTALAASGSLGGILTDPTFSTPTVPGRDPATNPVLASVRQIGYEVIQTIRQQRDVIEAAPV
ncbi:MAG: hypothetical protein SW019_26060 [Actinomycetota bacterium]|nr:hypothetical protein [Actinomycetota bacterium]